MTSKRFGLLVCLVPLVGCASLDPQGLWVLPELTPPERTERYAPATVAALGTASAPFAREARAGSEGLELVEVLESVEATYPLLSVARQEQVIAEAKQLSAMGAFDLQLGGGASWSPRGFYENHSAGAKLSQRTGLYGLEVWGGYRVGTGDFDPTFDGKRVTNHGGEFSLGANLPLLRNGAIDAARRDLLGAGLEREIAASKLATLRLRFEKQAAIAYWAWVAAGRRLAVASDLVSLAEERQQGLEARLRTGDIPEIEVTDNLRLVVARRALQVAARRGLEKTSLALSLFLRNEAGSPRRPSEADLPVRFPEPARPALSGLLADLESALRQRPDLRALAQERGKARVQLSYAENQLLPQVDVSVQGSQDLDRQRPSRTKGEFELTLGLEIGFPLQNRKARGARTAAEAELEQIDQRTRLLRDTIEAEVRDALSALQAAYETVGQAREAARLALRVAAAERRRFALGDSNVLRLNLREEAVAEAQLRLVAAHESYWDAAAAYRAAVGASRQR